MTFAQMLDCYRRAVERAERRERERERNARRGR